MKSSVATTQHQGYSKRMNGQDEVGISAYTGRLWFIFGLRISHLERLHSQRHVGTVSVSVQKCLEHLVHGGCRPTVYNVLHNCGMFCLHRRQCCHLLASQRSRYMMLSHTDYWISCRPYRRRTSLNVIPVTIVIVARACSRLVCSRYYPTCYCGADIAITS